MRAYFAYKTKRPFSFVANKGHRYKAGNRPSEFKDFSQFEDFQSLLQATISATSSAAFRMDASLEGTDAYPIDVDSYSLIPGVVYYDPNGHVLVVYKVDHSNGVISMLDGHPDGTVSRKTFGPTYAVGTARFGGGFKAWRQFDLRVVDQEKGSFVISRRTNLESDHFSDTAQYMGTYIVEGYEMTYHEWVASRVSAQSIYIHPVEDLSRFLDALCSDMRDRVGAVDGAMAAGMHLKPHPNKLPWNIYGAAGEWEEYASPGRDARLRAAVKEIRAFIVKTINLAHSGEKRLVYDGTPEQLHKDLLRVWAEHVASPECMFEYTNSEGNKVPLTLVGVMERLFDMSFDPYHCPELRWGATPKTPAGEPNPEFAACPLDRRKMMWYREERQLRNRTSRLLNRATLTHRGPEVPEDIKISDLFECYSASGGDFLSCHTPRKLAK